MQLSLVTLVTFLAACTPTASHARACVGKLHVPCGKEQKERRSDSSILCKERTFSTPDHKLNNEPISLTLHNGSQNGLRKDSVAKNTGQVPRWLQNITDKRIRKLVDSFRGVAPHNVGNTRKVKQRPHFKRVKDQGVQSVIHSLRMQALKAVENLKRKIDNGKLPDLLSPKSADKTLENKTLSTQENLKSSRNKLFWNIRKLLHRLILRKKKHQAIKANDNKHRKVKDIAKPVSVAEGLQRSGQKSARKARKHRYNGAKKSSSHNNGYGHNKSDTQKAMSDATLAYRRLSSSPPTDDDGKWANWLDLHEFFNQMKGLPMGSLNANSMYGAQSSNGLSGSEGFGGTMTSAAPATSDLTSPLAGADGSNTNAQKEMLQQQLQNQMQSMAEHFNTQAQLQGDAVQQPTFMSQPGMGKTGFGMERSASYSPTDSSMQSVIQANNPVTQIEPFLSRFYRPSMTFHATHPQYLERSDHLGGPDVPYQDQDQDRYRDEDDEEDEEPADMDPEDRDEEASDHDREDEEDERNDDDDPPYHRRQKSTIQLALNQSENQPRDVERQKLTKVNQIA